MSAASEQDAFCGGAIPAGYRRPSRLSSPLPRARLEGFAGRGGAERGRSRRGRGSGQGSVRPRQSVLLGQRVLRERRVPLLLAILAMLPARLRPGRLLFSAPLRPPAPRGAAAGGDTARSPGTARGKGGAERPDRPRGRGPGLPGRCAGGRLGAGAGAGARAERGWAGLGCPAGAPQLGWCRAFSCWLGYPHPRATGMSNRPAETLAACGDIPETARRLLCVAETWRSNS